MNLQLPPKCFISHAYADAIARDGLIKGLSSDVEAIVFPPITVPPDQFVSDRLIESLLSCDGQIYLTGGASDRSFWVAFERDYALRAGKQVFSADVHTLKITKHTALSPSPSSSILLRETSTFLLICCTRSAVRASSTAITAPSSDVVVERDDLVRGYEFAKGQYVRFTEAELESLETESSNNIDLKEFIPLSKIDPVYFDVPYYLEAAEGGEKPYKLLADALAKTERAAIAQLVSRGKEQLVLIRPYQNGLIMHTMDYANEVRNFGEIPKGENVKLSQEELTLGTNLIEQMSGEFDPENYEDEYRLRLLAVLEEKSKGQEITVTPAAEPRRAQVIDLMQALKEELGEIEASEKTCSRSEETEDSLIARAN